MPPRPRRAAEMLEQAGFALMEADGARDRVEALTATVRAYEQGLLALREGIGRPPARTHDPAVFEAERDRLGRLLAVLQGIESRPGRSSCCIPTDPRHRARGHDRGGCHARRRARGASAPGAQLEELASLRALQDARLSAVVGPP
jgi:hypothetical protein